MELIIVIIGIIISIAIKANGRSTKGKKATYVANQNSIKVRIKAAWKHSTGISREAGSPMDQELERIGKLLSLPGNSYWNENILKDIKAAIQLSPKKTNKKRQNTVKSPVTPPVSKKKKVQPKVLEEPISPIVEPEITPVQESVREKPKILGPSPPANPELPEKRGPSERVSLF